MAYFVHLFLVVLVLTLTMTAEVKLQLPVLPSKRRQLQPIPTKVVLDNLDILLAPIFNITNTSLPSSTVPKPLKCAVIRPLLKKKTPRLDPNNPRNYCPVPNLPYISELLEQIVADHLTNNLAQSLLD